MPLLRRSIVRVSNPNHLDLSPRIFVVDDERQIHASLRLRLAKDYELVCVSDVRRALEVIANERFDLCFVDIHMPDMDGLSFIESAQKIDPALGFVILSAFDTSDNLRRAIPLGVFDFIGKPLPERHEFEGRVPDWVARTRANRQEQALIQKSALLHLDLDIARLEREVELVASETARDALLQAANLLTTIQAHLWTASSAAAARNKTDPSFSHFARSLEEARKISDAAATVAQSFFDSAYASRDSSPALIAPGIRQACGIANRMDSTEAANKTVDLTLSSVDDHVCVRGLSGIEYLLMTTPIIGAALARAAANTTVGISVQSLARMDVAAKEPSFRTYLWANRRIAPLTQPGVVITVTAAGPSLSRPEAEAWLKDNSGPLSAVSSRGLVAGLQKCRGFLAISLTPQSRKFQLVVGLPT